MAVAVKLPSGRTRRRLFLSSTTTVRDLYAWVCYTAHEEVLSKGSAVQAVAALEAAMLPTQQEPVVLVSKGAQIACGAEGVNSPDSSISNVTSSPPNTDADYESETFPLMAVAAAATEIYDLLSQSDTAWVFQMDSSWSLVELYPRRVVPCYHAAGGISLTQAGVHGRVLFTVERNKPAT